MDPMFSPSKEAIVEPCLYWGQLNRERVCHLPDSVPTCIEKPRISAGLGDAHCQPLKRAGEHLSNR